MKRQYAPIIPGTVRLLLLAFSCVFLFSKSALSQTGTDFWFAPPEVTSGHANDELIELRISTGVDPANVTISMPAEPAFTDINISLGALSAQTVDLQPYVDLLETQPLDSVLNTGLHIESDNPITAYYEVVATNNPDIFALKGNNSLGTEFYVPFQQKWRNGNYSPDPYTSFDIVATEDNTTVLIYPSEDLEGGHPSQQSYSITLDRGETYSGGVISTDASLNPSGTIVTSDKPIAVSIKDDSVWPQPAGCRDINGDQLVPVEIVGKEYIAIRGGLTVEEAVYVTATANNTVVTVNGTYETTLFNGETYERVFASGENTLLVETNKAAYVTHMSGFGCETGTALLPPLNCAGSEQIFFSRSTSEYFGLRILVPTGAEDDFELNGDATLIQASDFAVVPGTGGNWQWAIVDFNTTEIPVNTSNLITNDSEVFSMGIINGGSSSGCRFGYFSEFSSEIVTEAGPDQTVCANRTVQLDGDVSGGATQGVWSTSGTGAFVPDANAFDAVYEPSLADISTGNVTLTLTSVSNCFEVEDEMEVTFTPAPVVDAGEDQLACGNNTDVTLDGFVDIAVGGVWSGGNGTFSPSATDLEAVYTPTPAEVSSGSVTLTLTTTGNGNCNAESDEMTITYGPAPTADAGTDATVCGNNADVVLNGSVTVATGGTWTGGTGSFSPSANALGATYSPSASEIAAGSVTLTLTTTGNGGCTPVSDDVTITITPAPVANAGADFDVCENNPDATLNGSVSIASGGEWSGGNGTFNPNNTTLNATYTPTTAEILAGEVTLTLTTTGNGDCLPETDDVTITINPAPVVDAGMDASACANNPAVTLNGTLANSSVALWSGGNGSFSPSATTLNATYTPTAAEIASGSVNLTLTSVDNGNCIAVSDQMTITYTDAPVVNAGANQTLCANNAEATLSGSITGAGGGAWSGGSGTFSPSNTALNATYTPTAAEISSGSVTLTLTSTGNGNCVAESDNIQINFTLAPTANAGSDQTYCANNSEVPLAGSVSVATGGVWSGGLGTFDPSPNDINAVYTPTAGEIANGSLTLTLTTTGNGDCSPESDDVEFTFTPSPQVDAGSNQTVCSNNADVDLNGSVLVATGGTWSGGNGSFSPNANDLNATYSPTAAEIASGSVTLTLTSTGNGDCNPVSDNMTINFTPAPTVNAGQDKAVCSNNSEVNLSGSVSIATGAVWSGGNGTFDPSTNALNVTYTPTPTEIANGSLTLTLTTTGNGDCNAVSDQVEITFTPAPTADAGVGSELCGNNADISLNGSVTVASGGSWSGGNGTFSPDANTLNAVYSPSATEIANGSVTLTLTTTGNGNCSPVTDDVTYTFSPAPTADAGTDQELCANNADVQLNGAVTVATGGSWSGGGGTFSPNANTLNAVYTPTAAEIAAGEVTLTLTTTGNDDCNAVSDDITIDFTPAPTADAGEDFEVCANNPEMSLSGSVTVATGGTWSGGAGTFDPSPNALTTTYTPTAAEIASGSVTLTLTTTGNDNCNPVSDQVEVTITPAPTANAGSDQVFCANNSEIDLNGSVTIATGGSWSGGNGIFDPDPNTLNATYTPTEGEINNGSVTLTLTTTGNDNCNAVTDDVTYTFSPAPTADAGDDQELCANNAAAQLDGAVTVATGGTWSGGGGTFNPGPNALNAVYTPTAAEITAGEVTLTLTTTGNGDCVAVTDDVTISFTPAPTADAGEDLEVCANNSEVNLSGAVTIATGGTWSGGGGTFDPSPNNLITSYTPSAAEIAAGSVTLTLTTTGNDNCNPVSDQVEITITPAPTANAGPDEQFCANNSEIDLNGSVTIATGGSWSGGAGTFTPDANTLNATYTPTEGELNNGSVTLTLTTTGNDNCNAVSDQVTYTFTPAPTADAGEDQELCANNADVQLDGAVTVATGGTWSGGAGTFNPGANALDAVYTPTAAEIAAGEVTLTLTTTGNDDCNPVSDDVTIDFTPAPTASAGADMDICSNNPDVSLNGSVTIASGGTWSGGAGTFTPDASSLNAVYTPTAGEIASGSLTLTLTTTGNDDCNAVSDQVEITFTPSPTADAGADEVFCSNNSDITLEGVVTVATGGTWSGGNGTFVPDANTLNAVYSPSEGELTNGSVTLTLTTTGNGNCNPVTDQVTYTFSDSPTADAGEDQELCANNADVQLDGAVTIASGGTWTGGGGTFNPGPNALDAVYTPTAGEISAGEVTLTLTTTGNGDCIAVTDDVTITFTPAPTADAGEDVTVCANNSEVNLNGAVTVATGGTWSGGGGTFDPSPNTLTTTYTPSAAEVAAGTVTLTLTTTGNDNCNAVSDQVEITITPAPTVDAGSDAVLCSNNADINLNGAVTIASGGTWSGGNGTFSPDANTLNAVYTPSEGEITDGDVTLTLTSTGNGSCIAVTDEVTYTFSPSPTADAGDDQELCANNADVQLDGAVTVATGGTWSGGAGSFNPGANALDAVYTPTAAEIAAGEVTLTLTTTGNGDCIAVSDDVTINFTPAPTADAGDDVEVCANAPEVNLNGSVTIATGGTWSGGGGTFDPSANDLATTYTPSAAEIAAGSVTLTLTTTGNDNCNAVTDQIEITITPEPTVDAGSDEVYCANNADIDLNGSVTIASGGTWSGGNGTFTPDANTLNATYTPSVGEISNGSVTLTLTTTGNGNCVAVTDDVTYTFSPAPTADAGEDQELCANNADVQLDGAVTIASGGTWGGGSGTFSPNADALDAVYTPTAAEIASGEITLTLTTTDNGDCNPVNDDVTINFTPAPTVNAGSDITVCANDAEVSLNGAVSIATGGEWTGGNGTFSPGSTALNAVYTPTASEIAAGNLTLTLTTTGNGDCNPESDQVEITFTPAPTADAGADQEFCANNADIDLNGAVTVASGGTWSGGLGTFTPDNNTLNATYTPTTGELVNGSVTLTLTTTGNGNCVAVTDEVTYTFSPAPTSDAGDDQTVCAASPDVQLDGAITVAGGAEWTGGNGSFSPNSVTLNAVYTPSAAEIAAGEVTLTLTSTDNGNCLAVSDEMTITIEPEPQVSAGPNLSSCANNAGVILQGSFSNAGGVEWTGGTGSFSPGNNVANPTYIPSPGEIANGSVNLTISTTDNGSCDAVTDQMSISISPAPEVNAGENFSVCENNAEAQLDGSVEFASGGTWSGGDGTFTPGPNTLNAIYNPTQDEIDSGSLTLTLTSTGNGNCNPVSDNVSINFTPGPTADAGTDQDICENNSEISLNGSFTIAEGALWSGGGGSFTPDNTSMTATYTPTASELANGEVTLTLTTFGNQNCLAASDQVTFTFTPAPEVEAGGEYYACVDDLTAELDGSVSGSTSTGTWTTSGSGVFVPNANTLNASYVASSADSLNGEVTLTLTSTNNGNCVAVSDETQLFVLPAGEADAGPDQSVCVNNASVSLDGTVSGAASSGTWTTSGNGVFLPNPDQLDVTYVPSEDDLNGSSVTLTLSANSCNQAIDETEITFTPAPEVFAGDDITVCESESEIDLNGSVGGASSTGVWTTTGSGTFQPSANVLNPTYVASAQDADDQTIQLILTATNIGNCSPVADTLTLNIFPSGTVDAGEDQTVCANNSEVTLAGSISGGADEGIWTTSGSGTFTPDPTALNATYVPTQADIDNGSVNLVLSATNSCNNANDFMVVTFGPSPVVDAGPDLEACEDIPPFSLSGSVQNAGGGIWASSGTGSFSNVTTLNTTYTASQGDIDNGGVWITLTSADNGNCLEVTDSLFIAMSTGIEISAGSDQTVCSDSELTQLQGSVSNGSTTGIWSTNGSGTFVPGPEALNAVYQFSQDDIDSGSINFTLTSTNNGACPQVSDNMTITFGDEVFVEAGDDQGVCADASSVQLNGVVTAGATEGVWTTDGDGTFSPSASALDAEYFPGTNDVDNGSVTLTLTSTDQTTCDESSDDVTINFQPVPTADAGEDILVCDNSGTVQLLGQFSGADGIEWSTSGTGTFSPNNTTSTANYLPSEADSLLGEITLTLTTTGNGACEPATDQVTVEFGTLLTADAGEDQTVCETEGSIDLSGSVSGTETGAWSTNGSGSFDPDNTSLNTSYTFGDDDEGEVEIYLTTTNTGGCPAVHDTLVLNIDALPTADAGEDIEACATEESIALSGTVENADGASWSTSGSGTFDPDATTLDANYLPSSADVSTGSVTITLNAPANGLCPGTTDEVTINFTPLADVDAGQDQTVCSSVESVALNGGVSGGASEGTWTTLGDGVFDPAPGELDAEYIPGENDLLLEEVQLVLTSTGGEPCEAVTDTVLISFDPAPTADAGDDVFTCENAITAQLSGSFTNAEGITWTTTGSGTFLPTPNVPDPEYEFSQADIAAGEIELILTTEGNLSCPAAVDTTVLTIDNPLNAGFQSGPACVGSPVNFTDTTEVLSGDIAEWAWDFGNGNISSQQNPTSVYSESGSYTVSLVVTSSLGCLDSVSQTIVVEENPTAAFDVEPNPAFVGDELSFVDESTGASSWNWDFGDTLGTSEEQNPVYIYENGGEFVATLTVTSEAGCIDSTSVQVTIEKERVLPPQTPNSFTPNDDNINDVFYVRGGPFNQLSFAIYDKWGNQVFESSSQDNGWDGTHNGKDMPTGTYVYTVDAVTVEDEPFSYSGKVTLIR